MRNTIHGLERINASGTYSSDIVIDPSYIFERKLIEYGIESKDINYTLSGVYYLDNVDSSVRAVFPLNSSFKLNVDSPALLLNLKERMFFPLDYNLTEKYYLNNVQRYDKYNELIKHESTSFKYENTDEYIGDTITKYVHKPIADTKNSEPIYDTEFETSGYIAETIKSNNGKPVLKIERAPAVEKPTTASDFKNFIMGPYTASTIAYRKFDSEGNYFFKNVDSELNLWFRFKNQTYNLLDILNGTIDKVKFSLLKGTNKLLYQSYLSEKFTENSLKLLENSSKSFELTLDLISKETNETDPDGITRICNFVGLDYKSSAVSNNIFDNKNTSENRFWIRNSDYNFINVTTTWITDYFNAHYFNDGKGRSFSSLASQTFYNTNIDGFNLYTTLKGFFINNFYSSTVVKDDSYEVKLEFYKKYNYQITESLSCNLICPARTGSSNSIKLVSETKTNYTSKYKRNCVLLPLVPFDLENETSAGPYQYSQSDGSHGDFLLNHSYTGFEYYDTGWAKPVAGETYYKINGVIFNDPDNDVKDSETATSTTTTYKSIDREVTSMSGVITYNYGYNFTDNTFTSPDQTRTSCSSSKLTTYIDDIISKIRNNFKNLNDFTSVPIKENTSENVLRNRFYTANKSKIVKFKNPYNYSSSTIYLLPASYYDSNTGNCLNLSTFSGIEISATYNSTKYDKTNLNTLLNDGNVTIEGKTYYLNSDTLNINSSSTTLLKLNILERSFLHKLNGNTVNNTFTIVDEIGNHLYTGGGSTAFVEFDSFTCSNSTAVGTIDGLKFYSPSAINEIKSESDKVILSNINSSASKKTYLLKGFFKAEGDKLVPSSTVLDAGNQGTYVYPGFELNTNNVLYDGNGKDIYVTMTDNNENPFSVDTSLLLKSTLLEDFKPIIFYFDESCSDPFELGNLTEKGTYEIYKHNSIGKKIKEENEGTIVNNVYVSKNYKILYKFAYSKKKSYQWEYAKDWYNINTYIKYDRISNKYKSNYQVLAKHFISGTNPGYSDASDFIYYNENKIIDDQVKGSNLRAHIRT